MVLAVSDFGTPRKSGEGTREIEVLCPLRRRNLRD